MGWGLQVNAFPELPVFVAESRIPGLELTLFIHFFQIANSARKDLRLNTFSR